MSVSLVPTTSSLAMSAPWPFRFDAASHVYTDAETGAKIPNITSLLELDGLVNSAWYTEECSVRGTAVHNLTADYDLGELDVHECVSPYRGWLLAFVTAVGIIRPTWTKIEEPNACRRLRFAGRADRVGHIDLAPSVLEVKSGLPEKSHPIQLAMQALLEADDLGVPPEAIRRYTLYLRGNGKFSFVEHKDRHDLTRARSIIARFC